MCGPISLSKTAVKPLPIHKQLCIGVTTEIERSKVRKNPNYFARRDKEDKDEDKRRAVERVVRFKFLAQNIF